MSNQEQAPAFVPVEALMSADDLAGFLDTVLTPVSQVEPTKAHDEMKKRFDWLRVIAALSEKNKQLADSFVSHQGIRQGLYIDTILLLLRYAISPDSFEVRRKHIENIKRIIAFASIDIKELLDNNEIQETVRLIISVVASTRGSNKAIDTYNLIGQVLPMGDIAELIPKKDIKQFAKEQIIRYLENGVFDEAEAAIKQYASLLNKADLKSMAKAVVSAWFNLEWVNIKLINEVINKRFGILCDLLAVKQQDILGKRIVTSIKKLIFEQEILPRQAQGLDINEATELIKPYITAEDIIGSIDRLADGGSIGEILDGLDAMNWLLQLAKELEIIAQIRANDDAVKSVFSFLADYIIESDLDTASAFAHGKADIEYDGINYILDLIGQNLNDLRTYMSGLDL